MSANVENLFYVSNEMNNRFVPWHGLGTPVKEALKSEEAIKMAGLDWSVDKKFIYDESGNIIKGYIRNARSSDNHTLGIVSGKYKIVQNHEAFEFTNSLIGNGVTYETAGSLNGGKRVWLLAKLPESKILNDKFENYIVFTNSHDGTGAVQACVTPVRVVCQNTLNLALNDASRRWSTRHMGDLQSKLAEGQRALGLAETYIKKLDEEANHLVEIKVDEAKIEWMFDRVFPVNFNKDTERKIRNVQTMKENLFRCLKAPDLTQYKGTAWGVINAVTDFADHAPPVRLTNNYQENNWGKIMIGHPVVDNFYSMLKDSMVKVG